MSVAAAGLGWAGLVGLAGLGWDALGRCRSACHSAAPRQGRALHNHRLRPCLPSWAPLLCSLAHGCLAPPLLLCCCCPRCSPDFKAEFVCCGLRKRNVGAFLNHSCAPNCFVQPVLDAHHDTRLPKICIFAMGALTWHNLA